MDLHKEIENLERENDILSQQLTQTLRRNNGLIRENNELLQERNLVSKEIKALFSLFSDCGDLGLFVSGLCQGIIFEKNHEKLQTIHLLITERLHCLISAEMEVEYLQN